MPQQQTVTAHLLPHPRLHLDLTHRRLAVVHALAPRHRRTSSPRRDWTAPPWQTRDSVTLMAPEPDEPTEDVIVITYEDGKTATFSNRGSSLLHLAGTGALDMLIEAHEPHRTTPDGT